MVIPDFVYKYGGKESDWFEEHDRLNEDKQTTNLPSNTLKWWLTNFKIRKALTGMKEDVRNALKSGDKVLLHVISENHLSKMTGVSRVSISHPNRHNWITKELSLIRDEILASRVPEQANDELSELKEQLLKARQETFVWYSKVINLGQEKAALEKIIVTLKKAVDYKKEP